MCLIHYNGRYVASAVYAYACTEPLTGIGSDSAEGSEASGALLKYSCCSASAAVMRCDGCSTSSFSSKFIASAPAAVKIVALRSSGSCFVNSMYCVCCAAVASSSVASGEYSAA